MTSPHAVPSEGATFDVPAFVAAFDSERRRRGLSWYEFAHDLWQQSAQLNAARQDPPI